MNALVSRLIQFQTLRLVLYMWGAVLLVDLVLIGVLIPLIELGLLNEEAMGGDFLDSMSFTGLFIMVLILAPVLETLIFQFALLLLVRKLTQKIAKSESWLPALLITSLAFAAVHAGNAASAYSVEGLAHAITRVPAAFLFTLLAVVERQRETGYPVLAVILLHSLNNLIPALLLALY